MKGGLGLIDSPFISISTLETKRIKENKLTAGTSTFYSKTINHSHAEFLLIIIIIGLRMKANVPTYHLHHPFPCRCSSPGHHHRRELRTIDLVNLLLSLISLDWFTHSSIASCVPWYDAFLILFCLETHSQLLEDKSSLCLFLY